MSMLEIKNLHVTIEGKEILKGINLNINPGEIHAIMGPNGSGKSTLAKVLTGMDMYDVTHGEVTFFGEDLLSLSPEKRAHAGIFLAFQYPVEIAGIPNINFLKASLNAIRKAQGKPELDAIDFLSFLREKAKQINMDEEFLYRSLNEGFSGGEKKRNEIMQMSVLEPKLAILDETDSGLDIDALKDIADGVNTLHNPQRSTIIVTHYQRLLDYIRPDYVHILSAGKIVKSGDASLATVLEEKGYGWLEERVES